jgi:alpha-tubulin suppressor-like RCC1 family protein
MTIRRAAGKGAHSSNPTLSLKCTRHTLQEQAYHVCVTFPGRMASALALGWQHSCALLVGGGVACWGYNFHGQLGIGSTVDVGNLASQLGANMQLVALGDGEAALHVAPVSSSPKLNSVVNDIIGPGGNAGVVATGANHTCALRNNRDVVCWGRNLEGQLGIGSTMDVGVSPEQMGDALQPAIHPPGFVCGLLHTLAHNKT